MKIAMPVAEGVLCAHFGQCTHFALFDVDREQHSVLSQQNLPAPAHQPGVFPEWLAAQGVNVVVAGGMGSKARDLFADNGIEVITGASSDDPQVVVTSFLARQLVTDANFCEK